MEHKSNSSRSTKNSTGKVDTSNPQPRSPPTALSLILYYKLHSLKNGHLYEHPYTCTLNNFIRQRSRPHHRLKDRFLSLSCTAVIFWFSFLYTTTHPCSCITHRVHHEPYPTLYTKFDRIVMPPFFFPSLFLFIVATGRVPCLLPTGYGHCSAQPGSQMLQSVTRV